MSEAGSDSTEIQGLVLSDLDSSCCLTQDARKVDHCDILLDAMDKQLDQLQIQSHKGHRRVKDNSSRDTVWCGWSQSVSKDTGLGSTQTDTPLSCRDLQSPEDHSVTMSDSSTGFKSDPESKVPGCKWSRSRVGTVQECSEEQALWRLQRLLGERCEDREPGPTQPLSDSICTEDFAQRFSLEMVHEPLSHKGVTAGGAKALHGKRGAGFTRSAAKTLSDNGHTAVTLKAYPPHEKLPQISTSTPKTKTVAGVPVISFDCVSIDSDVDSVSTEKLQQHIHRQPGWHSFIESVQNLDELWNLHRHDNTLTPEEREPMFVPDKRDKAPHLREQCNRPSVDDDKDLEEAEHQWSTMGKPPEWAELKERLCSLQQKCQEEEKSLQFKRSQVSEVERCLTNLQQRKQEAVWEMQRLKEETEKILNERKALELLLRQTKAERDSVRHELEMLEKQKKSALHSGCRSLDVSEKRPDVVIISVLEREEMERQLTAAKSDLFTEQQRARDKVEAIQERLEEAHEELQKATDTESSLRNKCASLEEQQRQTSHKLQSLESQVCDLQGALQGGQLTVKALEKILSEKELQLLDLQKRHTEVQSHREQLEGRLQQMKTHHYTALREAREQAHTALQTALEQHKRDLDLQHQRELHKLREEDAKRFKEELEVEVLKKVQSAVEEEHRRWEMQRKEVQCVRFRLEQQHRDREGHLTNRIHQEKNKAQALSCKLKEMTSKQQRTAVELKQCEAEVTRLKRTLEERERAHSQSTAEGQHRAKHWALELFTEVRHLQGVVQNKSKTSPEHDNSSFTAEEALSALRTVREQIQSYSQELQEELRSLKDITERLCTDKEQELSVQRQQLRREQELALDSLKERLILEHIEELSSLRSDDAAEGLLACLRSQLQAKDEELRQVQRSMAQWKESTAHRMARKYEEELTAELERCKAKVLKCRTVLKADPAVSKEELDSKAKSCAPSALDCTSDTVSLKLLCHLQTRVKQLRKENQSHSIPPAQALQQHLCITDN